MQLVFGTLYVSDSLYPKTNPDSKTPRPSAINLESTPKSKPNNLPKNHIGDNPTVSRNPVLTQRLPITPRHIRQELSEILRRRITLRKHIPHNGTEDGMKRSRLPGLLLRPRQHNPEHFRVVRRIHVGRADGIGFQTRVLLCELEES